MRELFYMVNVYSGKHSLFSNDMEINFTNGKLGFPSEIIKCYYLSPCNLDSRTGFF